MSTSCKVTHIYRWLIQPRRQRDMLQWLLEEARAKGTPFDNVVEKVLLVNFGAIHTSSGVRFSCVLSDGSSLSLSHVHYAFAMTGVHTRIVQPRGTPPVHPAAARRGRSGHRRGRMEQALTPEDAQARQLSQGVDASRRWFPVYVSLL